MPPVSAGRSAPDRLRPVVGQRGGVHLAQQGKRGLELLCAEHWTDVLAPPMANMLDRCTGVSTSSPSRSLKTIASRTVAHSNSVARRLLTSTTSLKAMTRLLDQYTTRTDLSET